MYLNGSVGQKFGSPFLLRKASPQKGNIVTFVSEFYKQLHLYQTSSKRSPVSHTITTKGGDKICL